MRPVSAPHEARTEAAEWGEGTVDQAELDSLPPDFAADPYPYYSCLRSADPVYLSPSGVWVLTRYDDVASVLRDPRFGRKGFQELLSLSNTDLMDSSLAPSMLFQDPPDHTRLRNLVSAAFTPRVTESLRLHIQQIVDGLLDRVLDARSMDLIADFAFPLPLCVICEMLGVPAADRPGLRQWSLDIARRLDTTLAPLGSTASARAMAAHDSLAVYFRGLIAERRKHPQADLLTELVAAQVEGGILSESELLDVCGLLFVAGHETTVNLIGNGMLALLCHPMELRKLHEDPGMLPSAVEELLRWDSPVQRVGRVANTDAEIGRKTIPKGAVVSLILGAANRDPAQFPEPDRLDITRRDNRHLAFGWGARYCLGAPLACVEGQIAIGTLVRRLPKLELASDPPEWRNTIETRGLKELQVTFQV